MYKFTNGIVVFDKKMRDNFLKAGYSLKKEEKQALKEDKNESDNRNKSISEIDKGNNKKTGKNK